MGKDNHHSQDVRGTVSIRAIEDVRLGDATTQENTSNEEIGRCCTQALGLDSSASEEQAWGCLPGRELWTLSSWKQWKRSEHKQLNQFHNQCMSFELLDPTAINPNSMILSPCGGT